MLHPLQPGPSPAVADGCPVTPDYARRLTLEEPQVSSRILFSSGTVRHGQPRTLHVVGPRRCCCSADRSDISSQAVSRTSRMSAGTSGCPLLILSSRPVSFSFMLPLVPIACSFSDTACPICCCACAVLASAGTLPK